jgi:DNA-binding transcriptional LysR family regulator
MTRKGVPMELRHLRYFVAVAELKNFTRAAERSFVAQSALSQQIGRLEREVGALLFARTTHAVELTPAGAVLLPHARRILADVDLATAELRAYLGLEKGHLRLGLIQTSASAIDVIGPIRDFHESYPEIDVSITNQPSTDMLEALDHGLLDVAVVGASPDEIPAGLQAHLLATDPLVGVYRAERTEDSSTPVELEELLRHGPLISFAVGTGIRRHVDEAFARAGIRPTTSFEMSQANDMIRYAALGLGVTIVPRALARVGLPEAEELGLAYRTVPLTDALAVHPISVVFDPTRISAAGRVFLDSMRPRS